MKVVLIYPGISWTGFNSFGRKNCSECSFVHHGIGSIASYLNKNGVGVEFWDLRRMKNWKELETRVSNCDIKVFGISSTSVDFDLAIKTAKIIKKIKKQAKVIVGGVHPTVLPKKALAVKYFDYVICGEGEIAFLNLIKTLEKGENGSRLIKGEPCPLEDIPFIDRDLFDFRNGESKSPFVEDLPLPFATVMSSRGCPFQCNFCQPAERKIFGGKVRLREMSSVVAELVEIEKRYGLKSFLIHDDLFILNRDRIIEFVDLFKKAKLKAVFICQARADLVIRFQKEIALLQKIGLRGLMIGFESGSQRVLDFINKGTTVEQNYEAARICKKLGIKVWANYMMALPGETYWEIIKTLWMIRKIKPDYLSPSFFTPYPGTGLYDYCRKEKLFLANQGNRYRRSLGGRKIKGVNYTFVRLLIFFLSSWDFKMETLKFFLKKYAPFNKQNKK